MNKSLTIVIPHLNDEDLVPTIKSIYETIDIDDFEIITIDDFSEKKYDFRELNNFKNIISIRNPNRYGVDGCRQLGVELSKKDNILLLDAHMRFKKDHWASRIINCLDREPQTIWCTTCLVLGYGNMDINKPNDKYYGATILLVDKNSPLDRPCREVMEPKWTPRKDNKLEYEIPCVLGANYFFKREWFNYLHGLKGLRMWGTSESFLSLKSWLAGGRCKITTEIEIGHKFRKNAPYSTVIWFLVYNKLYLCKTILPEIMSDKLIKELKNDRNLNKAISEINKNKDIIEAERKYYDSIFKVNIESICEKFSIAIP